MRNWKLIQSSHPLPTPPKRQLIHRRLTTRLGQRLVLLTTQLLLATQLLLTAQLLLAADLPPPADPAVNTDAAESQTPTLPAADALIKTNHFTFVGN
ncbi:MAG: hypothetical protein U5L01_05375 [Rheinheimera sp.]|nr:hypothetical protein [Rheinheimera sp.]